MAKGTFTVTLSDGTRLENLRLNGNNFISQSKITPETFSGKLSGVTITNSEPSIDDAGLTGTHEHMQLIQITQEDGDYWFILADIPPQELERQKMKADIAYMSMMSGIDLD